MYTLYWYVVYNKNENIFKRIAEQRQVPLSSFRSGFRGQIDSVEKSKGTKAVCNHSINQKRGIQSLPQKDKKC